MSPRRTPPTPDVIETLIRSVRGQRVLLDTDLAKIYAVPTFRLNEAVKRNRDRFPADFRFRLTRTEYRDLTSQIAISSPGHGGRRTLPWAFTEHGSLMAANILNSPRAVRMSVFVVRAFLKMRSLLAGTGELARQLKEIEAALTARLDGHEAAIVDVLQRLMRLLEPPVAEPEPPRREIGFHTRPERPSSRPSQRGLPTATRHRPSAPSSGIRYPASGIRHPPPPTQSARSPARGYRSRRRQSAPTSAPAASRLLRAPSRPGQSARSPDRGYRSRRRESALTSAPGASRLPRAASQEEVGRSRPALGSRLDVHQSLTTLTQGT